MFGLSPETMTEIIVDLKILGILLVPFSLLGILLYFQNKQSKKEWEVKEFSTENPKEKYTKGMYEFDVRKFVEMWNDFQGWKTNARHKHEMLAVAQRILDNIDEIPNYSSFVGGTFFGQALSTVHDLSFFIQVEKMGKHSLFDNIRPMYTLEVTEHREIVNGFKKVPFSALQAQYRRYNIKRMPEHSLTKQKKAIRSKYLYAKSIGRHVNVAN